MLKPGKPPNLSTSYRSISLLSPVVKILERMLPPLISAGLPISRTQHGFAAGRSTTTALLSLVTMVANGFNQNKPPSHTAAAILDISKAFDVVNLTLLIQKISGPTLQPNLIC
jgi:hypothetical protein